MKKLAYQTPDVNIQVLENEDVLTYSYEQSGYGDSYNVNPNK